MSCRVVLRTLGLLAGCVALVSSARAAAIPIAFTGGFTDDLVVDKTASHISAAGVVTATMDGESAKTGYTWYQTGYNTSASATGLPMGTTVTSASDPTTQFTLAPAWGNNALLLDQVYHRLSATLTLAAAARYTSLSFLTASALVSQSDSNPVVWVGFTFSDGTAPYVASSTGLTFTSPNWIGGSSTNIAVTAGGASNVSGQYEDVNASLPKLYDATVALPASLSAHPIASIQLRWTACNYDPTAIFAVSGSPVLASVAAVRAVPEPASLGLLGVAGLGLLRRQRR